MPRMIINNGIRFVQLSAEDLFGIQCVFAVGRVLRRKEMILPFCLSKKTKPSLNSFLLQAAESAADVCPGGLPGLYPEKRLKSCMMRRAPEENGTMIR